MLKRTSDIRSYGFQLVTRLKFHQLALNSRNLSQGDSQGVSFAARSYDLARPGVAPPPMLAVLFHLYSAADTSIALLFTE